MPSQNNRGTRVGKSSLTTAAMLACLAIIFSYVEFLLPFNFGIPGVKLGIANLVILITLYGLGWRYALSVNVVRIVLSGLLFSGAFGILYSLAGGLLSLLIMVLLYSTKKFSIVGVSMAGGVAHNLGQILVASFIVSNLKIFIYFPVLLFSGLVTGIILGFIAYHLSLHIPENLMPELRKNVVGKADK